MTPGHNGRITLSAVGAPRSRRSVVTTDVAPGDLALARAPQVHKVGWAKRFMDMMRAKKAAKAG